MKAGVPYSALDEMSQDGGNDEGAGLPGEEDVTTETQYKLIQYNYNNCRSLVAVVEDMHRTLPSMLDRKYTVILCLAFYIS